MREAHEPAREARRTTREARESTREARESRTNVRESHKITPKTTIELKFQTKCERQRAFRLIFELNRGFGVVGVGKGVTRHLHGQKGGNLPPKRGKFHPKS